MPPQNTPSQNTPAALVAAAAAAAVTAGCWAGGAPDIVLLPVAAQPTAALHCVAALRRAAVAVAALCCT
eukprot:scaffold1355_cov19-Tisochrysis_lutea.AAC.1